jgi:hypothetical protein
MHVLQKLTISSPNHQEQKMGDTQGFLTHLSMRLLQLARQLCHGDLIRQGDEKVVSFSKEFTCGLSSKAPLSNIY